MAENDRPPEAPKDFTPPLPQQVRDQMAAAEALRAELQSAEGSTPPPTEADAPSPPQPEPQAAPGEAEGGDSWEQRAKSTAGRLEQAVRANQALSERMQQLEQLLTSQKIRGEPDQPDAPRQKPKLVTEEEARDYGDEFLTVVGKRAREEYAPEFDELASRLKRLEGRVEGVGSVIEKTQVNDVYGSLAGVVPNWRDVNRSEQFKTWLQYPDPFSGRKRHDMLLEAFSGHDSARVVAFFKGYLTEAAGLPQAQSNGSGSAPPLSGNGNGSGKPSLADFAAPGRARSGQQPVPPDKPVYTSAWIAKFAADKRTGKYRGREADADAIERDIFQAQHEGRIQ